MAPIKQELTIHRCSSCRELAPKKESCCGELEEIEVSGIYEPPEMEQISQQVFGITPGERKICEGIILEGEATVSELRNHVSVDRSTISRRLNHLVDLGLVYRQSEALKKGGRTYVYSFAPLDEVQRKLQVGLYLWTRETLELTDELVQEKKEIMAAKDHERVANESNSKRTDESTESTENINSVQIFSMLDGLFD